MKKLSRLEVKAKLKAALALIDEAFENADQSDESCDFYDVFMHMQTAASVEEGLSVAISMLANEEESV